MQLNRLILSAACAALLLGGCARPSVIGAVGPCALPEPDPDWQVARPESMGFEGPALCALLKELANSEANIHGVVVERHGRLVAELYRSGPDRPISVLYGLWNPFTTDVRFDAATLHDVRSVSKSVVGLLIGIAVAKRRMPDVEAAILDIYPELADLRDRGQASIRIGHLLTMSSGLDWSEWSRGALTSDETRLYWKSHQARFVLERSMSAAAGTNFNYNGGGTAVLADALVRVTGKPLGELAREDLFEPLGITRWEWVTDMHDRPLAFAGLRLRPRDMLKIGRLVNDRGQWRGRQIVPEKWVAESLRPHISTGIGLFALANEASEAEIACFSAAMVSMGKGWDAGMKLLTELLAELQA